MRLHQALRTRYRRRPAQFSQSAQCRPGPEWAGGAEFIDHDASIAPSPQPPPSLPTPAPTARLEIEDVDPRFLDAIVLFLVSSGFSVTARHQLTVPSE